MKPQKTLLLFCLTIFSLFNACKKDNGDKNPVTQPDPVKPDLTVKISSTVAGFITDETDSPIAFAQVMAGDKQTLTDEYGYFKIVNASLPKTAGLVKVIKSGHFDGYRSFAPQENREMFVRIKLLDKNEIGILDAASGGTATTTDGGKITLPADGVVTASNGAAYTGQVHVSARWINTADNSGLQLDKPGDARGTDSAGYLKALKSFGTMAVELTGNNGQLLQIANGKQATITVPIPSSLAGVAPASIALWSLNDVSGLWKQESTAVKTGDAYVGAVSHFSFWEGATGVPLVNFTVRVVNTSSQPLANVPVMITIAGMPQNAGYGQFGYTDANGYITGAVFANASLVLDIVTPCAISAYSHAFTTLAADIDLGTLTGNLGQNTVTLSGTASNCSNQPVASGYVQTYDHGFYNRINITNGNFSFTGLACTNTLVNIVAVDNATNQQSTPQEVTLNPGINNLGPLTACGTSTMGSINFTIDGVTTSITEPTDTVAAYYLTSGGTTGTQITTLSGNPNTSQKMAFQFDGGAETGGAHHLTDVFSVQFASGRAYWPVPVAVNITEYGKTGGFISGSFSSNMLDFTTNALHTMSCNFRIRRYN